MLALLLPGSIAQAQSDLPQAVASARRAYTQTDEPDKNTLAQMPRRMGPMGRPPMRGPVYRETWGPQFSPGHALIGATIGFGFGAAAGSKNGVRTSLAAGALVGLLGAGIGAGIPSFPHYRRRGWDDEEASNHRPRHKPKTKPQIAYAQQTAMAQATPPESLAVDPIPAAHPSAHPKSCRFKVLRNP